MTLHQHLPGGAPRAGTGTRAPSDPRGAARRLAHSATRPYRGLAALAFFAAVLGSSATAQRAYEMPPSLPPAAGCGVKQCGERQVPDDPENLHLATGELHLAFDDLRLPGRGMDFLWRRSYRSQNGSVSALGVGWDHSYNLSVASDDADLLVADGDGRVDRYVLQSDGTYAAPGLQRILEIDADGRATLRFSDLLTWHFAPLDGSDVSGKIERIVDRNGNTIQFLYDDKGRLEVVVDTLGQRISVLYDENERIGAIVDPTGRSVLYGYTSAPGEPTTAENLDLATVTSPAVVGTPTNNNFPSGLTTTYVYPKTAASPELRHNLLGVYDALGTCTHTYSYAATTSPSNPEFDRVVSVQRAGLANALHVKLDTSSMLAPPPGTLVITKDRIGNVTESYYDAQQRLTTRRDFTGRANPAIPTTATTNRPVNPLRPTDPAFFETTWTYNAQSMVTLVVQPNGTRTRRVYEIDLDPTAGPLSRSNMRELWREPGTHAPVGDQASIVELFEYAGGFGGCCGSRFVSRYTDPRGLVTEHLYDSVGNRTQSRTLADGATTNFVYDAFGRLIRTIHPVGPNGARREDARTYHTGGTYPGLLATVVVDATGLALTTARHYDAWGNVIREVDPRGNDRLHTYNALGQIVREESPTLTRPNGTTYRVKTDRIYDAARRLVAAHTDNYDENGVAGTPARHTSTFGYATSGLQSSWTVVLDGNPVVIEALTRDAEGHVVLERRGEAVNGNQVQNEIAYEWDERGLAFRTVRAPASSLHSTEQTDYDGNKNVVRHLTGVESGARVTTTTYDAYDRRVQEIDPAGGTRTWNYDASGNVGHEMFVGAPQDQSAGTTPVRLEETWFVHDTRDREIEVQRAHFWFDQGPLGDGLSSTVKQYAANSALLQTTFDDGGVESYSYDSAGRKIRTTLPSGDVQELEYDAASNVTRIVESEIDEVTGDVADFVTDQVYDPRNLLTTRVLPGGISHSFRHDSMENVVVETDGRGNVKRHDYDMMRRHRRTSRVLTSTGNGAGTVVGAIDIEKTWDASNRVVAIRDGEGNSTRFAFDALDRVILRQRADGSLDRVGTGGSWALGGAPNLAGFVNGHDAHDDIVVRSLACGSVATTSYDAHGRIVGRTIVPGAGVSTQTTQESFVRDGLGRLVAGSDDDSGSLLRYDSLGALVVDEVNGLRNMSLADGRGREIATLNVLNRLTTFAYDTTSRLRSVDSGGANLVSYDYVGPTRISRRDYGNGTWTVDGYDTARRITSIADKKIVAGTPTSFEDLSFGWDAAGNKTSWIDALGLGSSRTMAYDSANRLTNAQTPGSGANETFTLDRAGNRTAVTGGPMPGAYTLSAALPQPADKQVNQYTSTPAGATTYSDRGTTTTLTRASGLFTFQYDYRGQLVSASSGSGTYVEAYAYDAFGRRISRTVTNGPSTTLHLTSRMGQRVLVEASFVNGAFARAMEYAHAVILDEIVTMWTNGVPSWFHTDDLYSVTCLTDAAGNVVERYRYGAAGSPTILAPGGAVLAESAVGNTRMYQSLPFDGGTGLYHNRARYYDPQSGRFLSEDPMGVYHDEVALGNGKTRVGNNPWSMMDPSGYQSRTPAEAEGGNPWLEWGLLLGGVLSAPFSWPLSLSFGIHWAFYKAAEIAGNKRWCTVEVTESGEGGPKVGDKFCYQCRRADGTCQKNVEVLEWDGRLMTVKFKSLSDACTDDCAFMVLDIYPI